MPMENYNCKSFQITALPRSLILLEFQFSSVQSLSRVRFFAIPCITGRRASLSITISRSSFKLMSIE